MPIRKSSSKSASKKSTKSRAGIYTTPRGNVSLAVPPFWTLRQSNDDLQMVSPSGEVSLILNAYQRNGSKKLDAREYLDHLLASAPKGSRVKRETATARRAGARYKDSDGTAWYVEFVSDGKILLFAEISGPATLASPEARTALTVMESLKIK